MLRRCFRDLAVRRRTIARRPCTWPPQTLHNESARGQPNRARVYSKNFPATLSTGLLFTEPQHEQAFADFANDEPCPVLDPNTGTCDLYAFRPVQCRTFGPPVRDDDDHLTVCELCFVDAPAEEVARCEMDQSWRPQEEALIENAEQQSALFGPTLVAFALAPVK